MKILRWFAGHNEQGLPVYHSRGNRPHMGVTQKQEKARRVRQIAAGIIPSHLVHSLESVGLQKG